jgi:hypothetical protein
MRQTNDDLPSPRPVRHPVQHAAADSLLLLLIAVFGATVLTVRIYLELTGFPQIGDSTFHIAHLLWGGLALFCAVLVLLILANRWALWVGALLGGIGVGLFIDEIGKLITRSVDYFYPLALPLIYGLLLLCVWLYLRLRRGRTPGPRIVLYHALEDTARLLDHNLDAATRHALAARLATVADTADHPGEQQLARDLLDFVESRLEPSAEPGWWARQSLRIRRYLAAHPSRRVLKLVLVLGFGTMALQGVVKLLGLATVAEVGGMSRVFAAFSRFVVVSGKSSYVVDQPGWLLVHAVLIGATGLLALTAVILLLSGRDPLAVQVGAVALVLVLTAVNLITFYFNQLYTVVSALGQLLLLGLTELYRWRLAEHGAQPTPRSRDPDAR